MNMSSDTAVEVVDLKKNYGPVTALENVNVSIKSGEYFVLLGPSGGGKTTLLRSIGGFIRPTKGRVLLHGEDVTDLPPDKRSTSMVFQSYALFPHMTVIENVGYGLKLAKVPKSEIERKSHDMLKMVGLTGYDRRKPHELSGGQQQRVQLARALVLERDILLLDEPLAALDAQLRKDMCVELKHLQQQVGITFIHVTHNQEEAMTVADRIALIADGNLVEYGPAREVYETPKRRFTASFVGENNLFDGRVVTSDSETLEVNSPAGQIFVPHKGATVAAGQNVSVSVRSEVMSLERPSVKPSSPSAPAVSGTYRECLYLGLVNSHRIILEDEREVVVRTLAGPDGTVPFAPGDPVRVTWPFDAGRLHTQ
ncbi:MAG: ABC transporter ATP-binding protein [Pseudomonadota bacterium]